jgi:hypothetical protein
VRGWCQVERVIDLVRPRPHIRGMSHFDLSDPEADALATLLTRTIDSDRYPLSPRIQTLRAILNRLRPEPTREPLTPSKVYGPPRFSVVRSAEMAGTTHND